MATTELPADVEKLRNNNEATVVVDTAGSVVLMNAPAEQLLGVEEGDIRGEAIELLLPEKMRFGHQAYRRGFFAENNKREMDPGLDPVAERPDGTHVPVDVMLDPIKAEDGKMYVAAYVSERAPSEPGSHEVVDEA